MALADLGGARVGVAHDLGVRENHTKGRECIVEQLLVHLGCEVTNEQIGTQTLVSLDL